MLPEPIDVDSVSADLKDGLLTVTLPKAAWPRSPPNRCHMIRKILLTLVLVVAGFVAGLVVTGRMRTAADSRAETPAAPEPQTPAPATERDARRSPLQASVRTSRESPRQAVKGVANISSLQVVRRQNSPFGDDPFFQYFFGRPGSVRVARSPIALARLRRDRRRPTAISSRTTTWSARTFERSRSRCPTSAKSKGASSAPIRRPTSRC